MLEDQWTSPPRCNGSRREPRRSLLMGLSGHLISLTPNPEWIPRRFLANFSSHARNKRRRKRSARCWRMKGTHALRSEAAWRSMAHQVLEVARNREMPSRRSLLQASWPMPRNDRLSQPCRKISDRSTRGIGRFPQSTGLSALPTPCERAFRSGYPNMRKTPLFRSFRRTRAGCLRSRGATLARSRLARKPDDMMRAQIVRRFTHDDFVDVETDFAQAFGKNGIGLSRPDRENAPGP